MFTIFFWFCYKSYNIICKASIPYMLPVYFNSFGLSSHSCRCIFYENRWQNRWQKIHCPSSLLTVVCFLQLCVSISVLCESLIFQTNRLFFQSSLIGFIVWNNNMMLRVIWCVQNISEYFMLQLKLTITMISNLFNVGS